MRALWQFACACVRVCVCVDVCGFLCIHYDVFHDTKRHASGEMQFLSKTQANVMPKLWHCARNSKRSHGFKCFDDIQPIWIDIERTCTNILALLLASCVNIHMHACHNIYNNQLHIYIPIEQMCYEKWCACSLHEQSAWKCIRNSVCMTSLRSWFLLIRYRPLTIRSRYTQKIVLEKDTALCEKHRISRRKQTNRTVVDSEYIIWWLCLCMNFLCINKSKREHAIA